MITGENTTAQEYHRAARHAASRGDAIEALRLLSTGFRLDPGYRPSYTLAASCLQQHGRADVARLFETAHNSFESANAFFDLGYSLIEANLHRAAAPFLLRALELDPYFTDAATELAVAFVATGSIEEARAALSGFDLEGHFWGSYQLHWTRLLCHDTDGLQAFIDYHREELEGAEEAPEVRRRCLEALDEIEECARRLNQLNEPPVSVRHWHFVQYGAALLNCPEEEDDPMPGCGRMVAWWPDEAHVAAVLRGLCQFLSLTDRDPARVIAMPNRDAEILGRAVAHLLDLEYLKADQDNCALPGSLVVAASQEQLASPALQTVAHEQTLFSFNINWTSHALVCPDVAGVMVRDLRFPWRQGALHLDPERHALTPPRSDTRNSERIAKAIARQAPEHALCAAARRLYAGWADHLKGGARGGDRRLPFMIDSPVPAPTWRLAHEELTALLT